MIAREEYQAYSGIRHVAAYVSHQKSRINAYEEHGKAVEGEILNPPYLPDKVDRASVAADPDDAASGIKRHLRSTRESFR